MPDQQDKIKAERIDELRARLSKQSGAASAFANDLFAQAAAEDFNVYSSDDLEGLTKAAYDWLKGHRPGSHAVRLYNPDPPAGADSPLSQVTIIEIVNDNMPFLVDSVMGEIRDAGCELRLVLHPIFNIARDKTGKLKKCRLAHKSDPADFRTSFIQVHVSRIDLDDDLAALEANLSSVLDDVRRSVEDWQAMLNRVKLTVASYKATPPPIPVDEIAECVQLLEWLLDDNFTFLGIRQYAFTGGAKKGRLTRVARSGLGILRDPKVQVLRRGKQMVALTPEIREFLMQPEPLIITKANVQSRIHRRVHMDYIGVKTFDERGHLTGELRLIGLFTSTAYTRSTTRIPYLRRKINQVIEQSGFDRDSHSGKALLNVLESYPRDELFQIDADTLTQFAKQILQLDQRPRIRVLARPDKFDRFVSVLVYVPRDRYTTDVRIRIGNYLAETFQGRLSAMYVAYPEGSLARVHFIIGRYEGHTPKHTALELEDAVANIVRTWPDALRGGLQSVYDPVRMRLLASRYGEAFGAAYREAFSVEAAVGDIKIIEKLSESRPTAIFYYRNERHESSQVSLKIFHLQSSIPLSERVPVLENTGFRVINERTYRVEPTGERPTTYLHDMMLERGDGAPVDLDEAGERLAALFLAIWHDLAEDDGYNALVLTAGLAWRDIAMVRAWSRYLRQIRIPYSQDYMWGTLNRYPAITAKIVDLFHIRFDPGQTENDSALSSARIKADIEGAMEEVSSLDDDRIIRRFVNLVDATLRTNFFQLGDDGQPKPVFSFKFDPRQIEDLPTPAPFREIFVYCPQVEGVHLRFGKVARGGLRWSDRPQDFRTEVLGLVKAQQVKNAVIVPVGAKGGFVPKKLPVGGSREEVFAAGTEAYKTFVSTLLDITDNLSGEAIIPPSDVIRHDDDDPYLVVAADKGTATFSDTANAIAQDHGYWLDDAFASGGSAGYDHKKMGITARGAWEAVKRHFREMDTDIQTTPFTVVGIGDMSGDVFGNGMLLSPAIKLVAAFDHRDIFIDPDPDPQTSFPERQRLFDMGRCSWQDYDTKLISKGGGVFSRALKSIDLSKQIQDVLGLKKSKATPFEIMRAILKADVDLLWFGGIGTYIRATEETNADADDRANDQIRITAPEVGAKVIGEGANLGLTQLSRIAFGQNGGRCNSDAVDNSAGVNSSDLEVNIKIALGAAVRSDRLNIKSRNKLLASMTKEVAGLCLRNNYLQTLSISLSERRGMEAFPHQQRLMQALESRDLLDREVELLPDDATMAEWHKTGRTLSRAEIGVLLAYAKIVLYDDLLQSDVPDDDYLARELVRYFPKKMQNSYADEIDGHRLRREIIATVLSNSMINRGGATLLQRIGDQTGATVDDIARAFAAVRDVYGLTALNEEIDALDNKIAGAVQLELYGQVQNLMQDEVVWFLRNVNLADGLTTVIERFRRGIDALAADIGSDLTEAQQSTFQEKAVIWTEQGVPKNLAERMALLPISGSIPDIVLVSEQTGRKPGEAATAFFAIAEQFRIGRLDGLARNLPVVDFYDGLALDRARQVLEEAHRLITAQVLGRRKTKADPVQTWLASRQADVERTKKTVTAITEDGGLTVSRFSVAASLLADLARG